MRRSPEGDRCGARRGVPSRRCVTCGRSEAKERLLRFVRLPGGEVAADPAGRMPGRGAYLCRREECLRRGLGAPAAFARSFRAPVTISAEHIQSVS